jgi:hypothetical protein
MTKSVPQKGESVNMGTMLESLETYYRFNGIYSLDFHCQHLQSCESGNKNFVKAKGAFVGTEYEQGTLPRLLFLSLDPGCSERNPEKRTPEYVRRKEEEECDVNELTKTHHWYLTHKLALTLLKGIKPDLQLQDTHLYFAHTNSAKCSMNNSHHKQAKNKNFKNCREYIGGEITILKPDILVTQGKFAKVAVEQVLGILEGSADSRAWSYKRVHIGGKKTLWFQTYHPRNFGKFKQQKDECFVKWAKIVSEHYGTTFKYP